MDERDRELIDRGFTFVARATAVEAAVRALMSGPERQQEWARMVLEGLPKGGSKDDEQIG